MPLDLTPFLRPERAALLELLRDLTGEEWAAPTECPAWSVKGIALHILGDDLSLLTRQRDGATDSLTLFAEDHPGFTFRELLDGFNEHWVSGARFLSPQLVIELLDLVGEWSADFYETVGLDTVSGEPVQFFATLDLSPYWQVIAREYAERVIHQSQIRRALGRPDPDASLLGAAAEVHAHLLAAWMRDCTAPDGSTIGVRIGAAGAWALTRDSHGWSVGAPQTGADAEIAVADDAVARFVGRGLEAPDLDAVVSFGGDVDLAHRAFDPIAALLVRPA